MNNIIRFAQLYRESMSAIRFAYLYATVLVLAPLLGNALIK